MMNGLPSGADGFVQAKLAIAPSNTSRIYASVASQGAGLCTYRSDDGGDDWSKITTDPQPLAGITNQLPARPFQFSARLRF